MTSAADRALRIPQVAPAILDAHNEAHQQVAATLDRLEPSIREVTTRWLRERAVEALAGLRASYFGPEGPLLLPVPRGYLGRASVERLAGTRRALDHIESRLSALADGELSPVISWETPFVIHALAAAATAEPGDRVSLLRRAATGWRDREHPFQPPRPEELPELLAATLARLAGSGDPPAVIAPWFAFAWMTLHPFEDGNGRTARLLHQLISAAALPAGADWGIAEMWVVHRMDYHERLKAGQGLAPAYDPRVIDARPFVEASLRWSTDGAVLATARIETAGELAATLPGSEEVRAVTLATVLHRGLQPGRPLPWSYEEQVDVLERSSAVGTVIRAGLPASRRVPHADARPFYVPTDEAWRRLERVLERRQARERQR